MSAMTTEQPLLRRSFTKHRHMPVVGSCQDAVLWVWLFDMRLFYIPEPPPVTMALLPVNSRAMLAQKWDGFVWMVLLFLLLRTKRATTNRGEHRRENGVEHVRKIAWRARVSYQCVPFG